MGQPTQHSMLAAMDRLFRTGTAAGLSDAQLLERFATRHGEAAEAAFAALLERHGPMVLRVCRRVLNDPHDAQDAFQATFLILVQKPGSVRQRTSLAGWLHGVALRVAAHSRAASARRRSVEQAAAPRLASGDVPNDRFHEVWEEVDRLPDRYRLAIVLCYLEGLTHEQAAARLGWPVGTVRSRLARARERLRGRLVKRGLDPGGAVLAGSIGPRDAMALSPNLVESTIKAAMLVAAHDAAEAGLVSASAAALTEGVLRTMFFAKLKTVAFALVTAGAVAAGAGVYGYQAPEPEPRPAAAPVVAEVPDDSPALASKYANDRAQLGSSYTSYRARLAQLGKESTRAKRLDSYPERIAELTRTAKEQQDQGDLRAAAETTFQIVLLASEWSHSLPNWSDDQDNSQDSPVIAQDRSPRSDPPSQSPSSLPRPKRKKVPSQGPLPALPPVPPAAPTYPQPPVPPVPPTAAYPSALRVLPQPASDTMHRLAEVEKKLDRLLRVLEGPVEGEPRVLEPIPPPAPPRPRKPPEPPRAPDDEK